MSLIRVCSYFITLAVGGSTMVVHSSDLRDLLPPLTPHEKKEAQKIARSFHQKKNRSSSSRPVAPEIKAFAHELCDKNLEYKPAVDMFLTVMGLSSLRPQKSLETAPKNTISPSSSTAAPQPDASLPMLSPEVKPVSRRWFKKTIGDDSSSSDIDESSSEHLTPGSPHQHDL